MGEHPRIVHRQILIHHAFQGVVIRTRPLDSQTFASQHRSGRWSSIAEVTSEQRQQLIYLGPRLQVLGEEISLVVLPWDLLVIDLLGSVFPLDPWKVRVYLSGLTDTLSANHAQCRVGISKYTTLHRNAEIRISFR